jgi:DNA-directed RNA polymerase
MIDALCPSYIHSLDASLLKIAFNEWVRPITSIHDCFKCLPTDMDRAQEAIRRAFYSVCDGNPLEVLADTLQVPSDTLERLPQGNGELQSVFSSTFLFN